MRSADAMGVAAAKGDKSGTRGQGISPSEVRAELEKILSSNVFSSADRMRRFLRVVVEETLANRGDNLNELLLGITVYDRDKKFDPRVDSIVRVDAGRLRSKLREFYASKEASSSIEIEIPKGSYKAAFKRLAERDHGVLPRPHAKHPAAARALAVLPFVDVSPRRGHDFLGDGIVEDLVHELIRIPEIQVVSVSSVMSLRAKQIDVREMGRLLGVGFFVEGSVLRVRRRIRIMVRLTDVATGFHTWSKMYTFVSPDVFASQERISKSIAAAISVRLGAEASIKRQGKR